VALAELALVLLPLCLVVFGAIDVGRAFIELDQLHNAAQAGAFFARSFPADVVSGGNGSNCADPKNIDYQVANEQSPNGTSSLTSLGYTVTVYDVSNSPATQIANACGDDQNPATSVPSGDTIEVVVSTPFKLVTPLIGSIVGNNITLHGTSEVVVP
jgi:Flp pilus assembly protein TadG